MDAIFHLLILFVLTGLIVMMWVWQVKWVLPRTSLDWHKKNNPNPHYDSEEPYKTLGIAIYFIGGTITILTIGGWLSSLKYWLGAFAPDLAIIYSLAQKAELIN
jgi:hypothetical protein